jgi:hypothetical protein
MRENGRRLVGYDDGFVPIPRAARVARRERRLREVDMDILAVLYDRGWPSNRLRITLEQLLEETCSGCWSADNVRHRLAFLKHEGWVFYPSPRGQRLAVYEIELHPVPLGAKAPRSARPMSDPPSSDGARPMSERPQSLAESGVSAPLAATATHEERLPATGGETHEGGSQTHEERAAIPGHERDSGAAGPKPNPSSQRIQRPPLSEKERSHPSLLRDERANDPERELQDEGQTDRLLDALASVAEDAGEEPRKPEMGAESRQDRSSGKPPPSLDRSDLLAVRAPEIGSHEVTAP